MCRRVLYAQPITRICSSPVDDVSISGDHSEIRFGKDAVPVPCPFSELIRRHVLARPNMNTAANPNSPWLFPGTTPGGHMHAQYLMKELRKIGIDLQGARNGALRELVLEIPPAVVAKTFDYSARTAKRHAPAAGAPWSSYPALRISPVVHAESTRARKRLALGTIDFTGLFSWTDRRHPDLPDPYSPSRSAQLRRCRWSANCRSAFRSRSPTSDHAPCGQVCVSADVHGSW